MTKRAFKTLLNAGYDPAKYPAIAALTEFAAQNSGIEPRNYFDPHDRIAGRKEVYAQGVGAYRQEQRSINQDWQRFKTALDEAFSNGVKDSDVIAVAPQAYSGRLTWEPYGKQGDPDLGYVWIYCTGQYFCTEYRKAAATVLEYASRAVKQNRPPKTAAITSISELKELNKANGGCWFNAGEMRFFGTKIETGIIAGHYFITSEQREPGTPRNFTIRSFDETGSVDTVGVFHSHRTLGQARAALAEHLKSELVSA